VTKELTEVLVEPDTYHVSPEPMLMVADLHGALALCLHDEGRAVGGLLHLRFMGGNGRPSDVTDNTLTSVLVVLDRFKRAVLGNSLPREDIQARILAHALPPTSALEPSASLVDLIRSCRRQDCLRHADDAQDRVGARVLSAGGGPRLDLRPERPARHPHGAALSRLSKPRTHPGGRHCKLPASNR